MNEKFIELRHYPTNRPTLIHIDRIFQVAEITLPKKQRVTAIYDSITNLHPILVLEKYKTVKAMLEVS